MVGLAPPSDHVVGCLRHEDTDVARGDEDSVARLDAQLRVAFQIQIDVQSEAELFREDSDFGDRSGRVDLRDADFETRCTDWRVFDVELVRSHVGGRLAGLGVGVLATPAETDSCRDDEERIRSSVSFREEAS